MNQAGSTMRRFERAASPSLRIAGLALMLFAPAFPLLAQQDLLRVVAPADDIPIGSAFDIGITAEPSMLAGATVTDVRFGAFDDPWHVAGDWSQPLGGNRRQEDWLWSARLQAFEVGELQIPDAEAVIRRPDGTDEIITLKGPVVNVVDGIDAADAELRDLHDIHPFRYDWRWIAAWAAGGLLAALALGLLARRTFLARRAEERVTPLVPPREWALGEIERRKNLPDCRAGNSKVIATEASDVIRHFLERQYGFNALDMTTRECVRSLEGRYIPGRLPANVRTFLEECDVAKFTRLSLGPGRETTIWNDAKEIVELAAKEEVDIPTAETAAETTGGPPR